MTSTPTLRRKLFPLLGSAALIAASLLTAPRPASALFSEDCDFAYYNNASHTTLVGNKIINCSGRQTFWGVMTQYSTTTCVSCG